MFCALEDHYRQTDRVAEILLNDSFVGPSQEIVLHMARVMRNSRPEMPCKGKKGKKPPKPKLSQYRVA